MFWSIIYLTSVLIAQYTATWFIPMPVFGLLAVGTLVFGVTFTARDYVHRLGRKYVYAMIFIAALTSLIMTFTLGVPIRIIIASIIAIVLAETVDTEVYHKLLSKSWLIRVLSSNSISIPLDTILFVTIAFTGIFSAMTLLQIIYAEIIAKYVISLTVAGFRRNK